MSEFRVCRTAGNGYCLILDGDRIAGGKPDYRGSNIVTYWVTDNTYGVVDEYERRSVELEAENAKLRDLVELMLSCPMSKSDCDECRRLNDLCAVEVLAREVGIEVGG